MTKTAHSVDLSTGAILPKMLRFALPLMLASLLQLLFNAADIIVVGKFCGDDSMAAVGSNGALVSLLTNFFIGLSVGVNVLAARYFGAKSNDELKNTVHTSMLLSVIGGVALTVIGLVFAPTLLVAMSTPEEILELATVYLRIYFLGMTATTVYNFGSALLRAIGDTKRPLYYLLLAGVVNIVLNVIFVAVFKMDVAGVAAATVISQVLSAYLTVRCLMREEGAIRLIPRELRLDRRKLTQIVRNGLPAGLQSTLFSLSNVVIQSSVNSFGDIVVAGNSAASNLEDFVIIAMNAFYQATISFTGQSLGVRDYKRIIRVLLVAEACAIVTGFALGGLLIAFGAPLLGIYSETAEVIAAGLVRVRCVAPLVFTCGFMNCLTGVLRGLGRSVLPMIVSLLGACGLRILTIATVFQIPEFHTIETIYASYPLSWTLTGLAHLVCFIVIMRKIYKKGDKIPT